ncbi:H-NS histone family protein [Massilia sp. LjRoot122]
MTDLSNLSIADMRNLLKQVEIEIKLREADEINKARDQILAIAQSVGVPLDQLLGGAGKGIKKGASGTAPVRFKHPQDESLKWSGRGRQPKWVKEWTEGGKPLDEIRVL